MPNAVRSAVDALSEPWPPAYWAVVLTEAGGVIRKSRIEAHDDAQATQEATTLIEGHAVELWDGLRFIKYFPPAE